MTHSGTFKKGNQAAAYDGDDVEEAKRIFLEQWKKTFNQSKAAAAAGMARKTFYRWLKEDPVFKEKFLDIRHAHVDQAEENLMDVSTNGKNENARVTASIIILNAHKPRVYKPKTGGGDGGNVTFQLIIGSDGKLPAKAMKTLGVLADLPEPKREDVVEGEILELPETVDSEKHGKAKR